MLKCKNQVLALAIAGVNINSEDNIYEGKAWNYHKKRFKKELGSVLDSLTGNRLVHPFLL